MADDIKKHGIVPDVVDDFTPSVPLQVSFGAGTKLQNIGDHLTPTQVKSMPQVTWDANPNDLYTLMMTDPDAPSRKNPIKREWIHWVVVNIPGNDLSKGQHAIEYVGAGPPQGSGPHRYVLLLFKQQQGKIDLPSSMRQSAHQAKHRANFNTRKFAEAHHLGKPVGCAMFQAEYDDWVPHLYKTLTD